MRAKPLFPILFILFIFASALSAQQRNYYRRYNPNVCNEPYSNRLFNRDFGALSTTSFRFLDEELHRYISYKCLSTDQILRLAMLYQSDRDKYNFLTYAYSFVFDGDNYALTANALANPDTRVRYLNFLMRQGVPVSNTFYGNSPIVYGNRYNNYPAYPANAYPAPPPPVINYDPSRPYNNSPYAGNVPYGAYTHQTAPDYNNASPQYNPNNSPQINNYPPQVQSQNTNAPSVFAQTVNNMRSAKTDVERLGIAHAAVRNNPFDAQQISELMRELPNDDDKLDLAQFSYTYVADPKNYTVVYSVLRYDTDKKQLQDYIARHAR